MILTEKERQLVETVRSLPPDVADRMLLWANQISALSEGKVVEWSDAWSDEDLADAVSASVRHLESQDPH